MGLQDLEPCRGNHHCLGRYQQMLRQLRLLLRPPPCRKVSAGFCGMLRASTTTAACCDNSITCNFCQRPYSQGAPAFALSCKGDGRRRLEHGDHDVAGMCSGCKQAVGGSHHLRKHALHALLSAVGSPTSSAMPCTTRNLSTQVARLAAASKCD